MVELPINFYSEGHKLEGTIYLPDDYRPGEKRPAIIPNSGFQGFNGFYPKLFSQYFTDAGYVCIGFDYRGFASSEGQPGRVIISEQVEDIKNCLTLAQTREEIDPERIGLIGWGMAAPHVIQLAATDKRVKAVAALNGFYDGERWLKSIHTPKGWREILRLIEEDRVRRVTKTMSSRIEDASHRSAHATTLFEPTTSAELQKIIQKSFKQKSLLTTVGGKTGLAGGCTPLFGGNAIDMSKYLCVKPRKGYENILTIFGGRPGNYLLSCANPRTGVFPAGITLAEMDKVLADQALFFAPKPGYMGGQLGGAVATNASGPRTLAYGDTRSNVMALGVVLPNGELVNLKRDSKPYDQHGFILPKIKSKIPFPKYKLPTAKNAVGFYSGTNISPIDLFVGCEGTLGIFTEIEVKLIDRRPIVTQLLFFRSAEKAFGFADNIRGKAGLLSLEFIDQNALSFVADLLEAKGFAAETVGAAVGIEYFQTDTNISELSKELCHRYEAIDGQFEGSFAAKLRYTIPQRINALMAERGQVKIASDFAVPGSVFLKIHEAYKNADKEMAKATGQKVGSATWGHLGNYHLHWNALPNSAASKRKASQLYESLAIKTLELGGTLSAEHGTGKKQIFPGMPMLLTMNKDMYGYARELISLINPNFLLNRGNMIGYPPAT